MRARAAILIALLIFGGVGADWWMDEMTDPAEPSEATAMDGGEGPPPSPNP